MATIAQNLIALAALKTALAENLTAQGVTAADTEPLADLVDKILDLDVLDTSDATATAGDIKTGKTAYVNGAKLTGNWTPVAKLFQSPLNNGNFAGGTTAWNANAGSLAVVSGILETIATVATGGVASNFFNVTAGAVYYICGLLRADTAGAASLTVVKSSSPYTTQGEVLNTQTNTMEFVSARFTMIDSQVFFQVQDKRSSGWTKIYADNLVVLNLSSIYGTGSEPSQDYMDDFVMAQFTDKFVGTTALPGVINL